MGEKRLMFICLFAFFRGKFLLWHTVLVLAPHSMNKVITPTTTAATTKTNIFLFFLPTDISLLGVKQALSLLRWQRERLDCLEVFSGSLPEGSFHLTICSMLTGIVSQVFYLQGSGKF